MSVMNKIYFAYICNKKKSCQKRSIDTRLLKYLISLINKIKLYNLILSQKKKQLSNIFSRVQENNFSIK